jgi:hypothetical protein
MGLPISLVAVIGPVRFRWDRKVDLQFLFAMAANCLRHWLHFLFFSTHIT